MLGTLLSATLDMVPLSGMPTATPPAPCPQVPVAGVETVASRPSPYQGQALRVAPSPAR